MFVKNRSELRDIIIKILYQTYIFESFNEKYEINSLIKEFMETKNDFVIDTITYNLKITRAMKTCVIFQETI